MLAVALGSIGIYGVMSYTVSRRTNEVGVSIAFGAQSLQILHLLMVEGLWLTLAGFVSGILIAWFSARAIASVFYGIISHDPLSIAVAGSILLASALAAVWLPSRRASRISPTEALRHQ